MLARSLLVALMFAACEADDDAPPPVAPAPQVAQVSVTVTASSTPTGAHVTGGGRALGMTPLQVQVPVPPPRPGEVQSFPFTFTMPGYTPVTINASPVNNTITINATLTQLAAPPPPPPPVVVAAPPSGELLEADARRMIVRYYAGRGEWAGQYVIARIDRMRMDRQSDDRVVAHTSYQYRCIIPECGGDQQVGNDQRTFTFQRSGGSWRVADMGGHLSARL